MQYLEFRTKKTCKIKGLIYYNNNDLSTVTDTKFLGLIIDNTLSWHQHVDSLTKRISSVGYALRCLKYLLLSETLKMIFLCQVHSVMS